MLQERGGLDGSQDDGSGLDVNDFLRFIQQLRQYTTAAEQQSLFELEARRPSAVATYLAVYALIGRGFAQRQPGLIYRAKLLLVQLGRRQDVHLEQAVCALLLGQTEQATQALELSQEEEPIRFIQEQSQGSPDLLPGLCLYGERWLQDEVFPHFRDLNNLTASLSRTILPILGCKPIWKICPRKVKIPRNGWSQRLKRLYLHPQMLNRCWRELMPPVTAVVPRVGTVLGDRPPSVVVVPPGSCPPPLSGGSVGRTSITTPRFPGANPFTSGDSSSPTPTAPGPRRRRRRDGASPPPRPP